ncbi:hypothetical protein [Brevundimonas sp.]|uniref:hypothetical protein n=1 Tax=Brevundimonas sp. TaxID=1871086 RepID=UPI0028965E3F|nr:hypothetical protein [Brevundimonas sp.]
MTFREKHLWVAIIAGLAVWGAYGWKFTERVLAGGLRQGDFAADMGGLFVLGLIAVVVLEMGLTALARLTTSRDERRARDEREGLATLQASHVSLMLLIGLLVTVAAVAYGVGLWGAAHPERLARWMIPGNGLVLVANAVLGCIMLSELARWALSLALLKRGR